MGLFDYLEDVGKALGETAVGTAKMVGGTAGAVAGGAIAGAGFVAEPILYGTGKVAVGIVEGIDEGNVLFDQEVYDSAQETLSWPGWGDGAIVEFGTDLGEAGMILAGEGAYGNVANAVQLAVPGGEDDPDNVGQYRDVMGQTFDTPSTEVQVALALLNPNKLGRTIEVAGIVFNDSTEWLESRGVDLPSEMTEDEYVKLLMAEKRKAEMQREITSLQSDVEEAEQSESITREQAFTYARILAGPDGWGKFGQSDRGFRALRDAQQGLTQEVNRSWNAWRAAGGTWRNDV